MPADKKKEAVPVATPQPDPGKAPPPEPEWNPALAPPSDVPEPKRRRYKVTGTQRVLDHDPGETFTATLPPRQEEFLLYGGHIQKVDKEEETA